MKNKETVLDKAVSGKRLSFEDAMELYQHEDLLEIAAAARLAKERKTGKQVFYNVNRHINLSNICTSGCPLCAFACGKQDERAYAMEVEDVDELLEETLRNAPGVSEMHMVSSLHPDKPFSFYEDVIKQIKRRMPTVHLKAFTPVEIIHFVKISGLSIREVLSRLKYAGLDSLPGGGAEILDDEVRQLICPNKASSQEWIDVMETAHSLGLPTNATMLYGHLETIEQRIRHLITLRDIQDRTGGFQAFVSFPFHPENTALAHLKRVSAWEDMKMIALARLVLDNFDHIKAFWMMLSLPLAQLSLAFGVDDLDGTVEEERIIHAAGATTASRITQEQLAALIRETGYEPVERDTFYQPVRRQNGVSNG